MSVKKFTLKIKYEAIVAFGEKTKSVVEIAKELKVAKNTIYDWIRIKDKIIEQYKSSSGSAQRVKTSFRPQINQALIQWFNELRSKKLKVNGPTEQF